VRQSPPCYLGWEPRAFKNTVHGGHSTGHYLARSRGTSATTSTMVETSLVHIARLCGGKHAESRHSGYAQRQCFFHGTVFAIAPSLTGPGTSVIPEEVCSAPALGKGEAMRPLEIAARYAAFAWYTNSRQAPSQITRLEARRFSRRNWRIFLPVADEGWGRLLQRIAEPPLNSQRPPSAANPDGTPPYEARCMSFAFAN
jgi:hypothetical protein